MSAFAWDMNILFIIFSSYFGLQVIYALILGAVGFRENRQRSKQTEAEDYANFAISSFTIPVSFIIPARNEQEWINETLQSILNLNYPEYEIIIVDDQSADRTLAVLTEKLKLEAVSNPFVDRFAQGKIRGVFKSKKYGNVTVLTKISGFKKAGAVNAGLNFARYKYVCVIDSDIILEPEALLKVMSQVQKDPDNIIGIGSSFGLVNGFKIRSGRVVEKSFSYNPLIAYQNIEYIRAFIGNRIAWSRFNASPIISGGFGIWRRDILLELGGFDAQFTCEDLEFTFRVRKYITENKKLDYKILTLPYYVGWTEGPGNFRSLFSQRGRWQRVTNETVSSYLKMVLNPQYKWFAFVILPYFLLYEVLGVFFEVSSIGMVLFGWLAGLLDIRMFLAFFALMVLTQTLISLISIFAYIREESLFRVRDIAYFIGLCFLEVFWYRWVIAIAKLWGTIGYLRGVKTFDQYVRTKSG